LELSFGASLLFSDPICTHSESSWVQISLWYLISNSLMHTCILPWRWNGFFQNSLCFFQHHAELKHKSKICSVSDFLSMLMITNELYVVFLSNHDHVNVRYYIGLGVHCFLIRIHGTKRKQFVTLVACCFLIRVHETKRKLHFCTVT
jgi:hypothetical protein